MVGYIDTHYGT